LASTLFPTRTLFRSPELFESLIHPDDRVRRREVLTEAIRQGSEARMEYRLVRPDGGVRWVLSHGRVYLHEDGTVKEIVGVASDIDRKSTRLNSSHQI